MTTFEMENQSTTGISLETIRITCGYQNYDAMRQAWYSQFGKEGGFPEKNVALEYEQAEQFLSRLSGPKPNKPEAVVQGALRLLEGLRKGIVPEVVEAASQPAQAQKPIQAARQKTAPAEVKTVTAAKPLVSSEELFRIERLRARDEEDRISRERARAQEEQAVKNEAELDALLSPWISGLTWVLNGLEMLFLIGGLYIIAGAMGLVVGLFLAVLGTIVLLIVRLQGSTGGYAVTAWFLVCSIGGWLVEYPAMLQAIEESGRIVSSEGETYAGISVWWYAGIVTFLMSGSSFAGTFFRYQKTRG